MRGNLAVFIALTISGILNFLAISLYSRLLSPAEYGAYAVVISSVALVIGFAFSWLELSFLRFSSGSPLNKRKYIFSNFVALYAVLLLILSTLSIIIISTDWFDMVPVNIWLVAMAMVASEVIFTAVNNYTRLLQEALIRYSLALIFRSILAISLSWYFIELGYGYSGILFATACSFIIPAILVVISSRVWRDISFRSIDLAAAKEFCQFGIPLVLVMVLQSAISATDRFLLAGMLGTSVAGQYSVSQDIVVKLFIFLLAIVHKVTYPLVVKSFENYGSEGAQIQLKQNIVLLLGVSIPAVFAMSLYADNIVSVVLGADFRELSAELMPYQVVIAFINCLSMFYIVMPFHLLKKTNLLVVPSLVALLGNIVISYLAIGVWGIYGGLLGSFVAYSLYFLLAFIIGRRLLKLSLPLMDLGKIIVSAALMVFVLLPFKGTVGFWPLTGLVVVGIASYAIIGLILNINNLRIKIVQYFFGE